MVTTLLTVEELSYSYRPFDPILRSIFLQLQAGSVTGFLGKNGTGKSTFFKCLTGEIESRGSVFLHGKYLDRSARAKAIGYLPQSSFLPKEIKVHHVFRWVKSTVEDERIESIRNFRVGDLSTGQRRYLEFHIVLGMNKEILLLDEPFSTVEPIYVDHMVQLILNRCSGRSIMVSDHNFGNLVGLCDKFVLLSNGRVSSANGEDDLRRVGYLR